MNIIGLSGSPTAHSRSNWLLQQFLQQLQTQLGADAEVLAPVRVRDLPATALLHADFANPEIVQALGRVAKADVVVIATPIYKAAYSGLLKTFLDLLPQDGLQHKAVVALATGGSQAHFLAVDYALKPVLSALGTREVLDTVYATDSQLAKLADGIYTANTEIEERLHRAAHQVQRKHAQQLAQKLPNHPSFTHA
jgi:FMN reductase